MIGVNKKCDRAVRAFAESIDGDFNGDGEGIEVKMPAMLVFRDVKSEQDLLDRVRFFYQGKGMPFYLASGDELEAIVFAGNVHDDEEGFGLIELS